MKRFFLSVSATALLASSALAADIPIYEAAPEAVPVAVAPLWTGGYIGLQAGGAFGLGGDDGCDFDSDDLTPDEFALFLDGGFDLGQDASIIDPADPIDCDSFTEDGDDGDDPTWVAGAHIGFDKQIGSFVIGALLDANWIDHDDGRTLSFDPDSTEATAVQRPGFPDGALSLFPAAVPNEPPEDGRPFQEFSEGSTLNWYGTARARAGFAAGRFLIYGTGGLAFGDYESEASSTSVFNADEADRVFGALAGPLDEFDPNSAVEVGLLPEGCAIGPAGTPGWSNGEPGVTCTSSDSDDEMLFGYALGAGVDVLLTDNFSLGAEYLYVNLGDADFDAFGSFDGDEGDVDFQTIMVKGSFRFGG